MDVKERLIDSNEEILKKYVHPAAAKILSQWIVEYKVALRITRERDTKLGDYIPKGKSGLPSISVNHNLNAYAFLITLVHEFAHHFTYMKYNHSVDPHGKEWKKEYTEAMNIFIHAGIFPPDVVYALNRHLKNPPASSCANPELQKVLSFYDSDTPGVLLDYLPFNALFEFRGKIFRKEEKRRKRIVCSCCQTGKKYLFSSVAKIQPVED